MAEILGVVTGILGALDVGIRWLKELHRAVEGYKHAGERLLDVHNEFEQFEQRLNLWAKTWSLGVYGPSTDSRITWGEKGAWLIQAQLVSIMKKCEDFKRIMSGLTSPKVLALLEGKKLEKLPLNVGSTSESRELADLVKQASKATDKAKFALLKASELASYVADLNTMYAHLDYDSKARCIDEHPEWDQTTSAQARMALSRDQLTLVHLALRTREASKALFQSCTSANTIGTVGSSVNTTRDRCPKFEMTLLKENLETSGDQEQTLRYHLLVPWSSLREMIEILIEGPLVYGYTSSVQLADPKDFNDVCEAISRNERESLLFKTSLNIPLWFKSDQPLIPIHGSPTTVLADLLEKTAKMPAYEALEVFPSSERLELAYKAVECGLFLLGTPWLSDLRSKRLERAGIPANRLFTLETGMAMTLEENFIRIGQQIFAIGVLLTEIGTGQPISADFLANLSSIPDILSRIPYGLKYAKAVDFCLLVHKMSPHIKSARRHGGDFTAAFEEVLHDYFTKVYMPIKSLMKFLNTE